MIDRLGRFSRLDLAILGFSAICGMLAAISSDREFLAFREWRASTRQFGGIPSSNPPALAVLIEALVTRVVQDFEAVLYATSPGLALIAYRPRWGLRPRRRGPGHVALAIAGGLVCYGLVHFCWFMLGPAKWTGYKPDLMAGNPAFFWTYVPAGTDQVFGYAIAAGWSYLAVIRGWRPSNLPLERAGRWLGLSWIIASVVSWGIGFIPRI